ncbi:MAG: acyl carrier protein [Candidatus Azosocius agrarius]|nr:MAG: acyl carrier protein [Gammaproteobacteria bacterium]
MNNSKNDQIINIISEQLGIDKVKINSQTLFLEHLGTDILDILEIIMIIEEKFNIEITDEEVKKILSVQDIFNLINNKIIN